MSTPDDQHLLYLVMNGHVVGDIQRTGKRQMRLLYSSAHLGDRFTPLSMTMPNPSRRYRETVLAPWLSGLLPDRPETLRQWRHQFQVVDVFSLLQHVGEDVAGAAQFVRPDRLDAVLAAPGQMEPLDGPQIAEMLRRALANLPITGAEDRHGKFSLAGAQAKIALHRTRDGWSAPSGSVPSTHIIKPAIPGLTDQDLVEAVTLRTAANLGLRAARCWVEEFADVRAIVVTRYDRVQRADSRWVRVHQEDMCQAMGVWPHHKYESQGGSGAAAIANLIHHTSPQPSEDTRRFAEALVFNWLICGTDAHARNYSLLLNSSDVRPAPLYDLNSHLAYSNGSGNNLSMSVSGEFLAARITVDDWVRFAPALHADPEWLRAEIARQQENLLDAMVSASTSADITAYESPATKRLIANTEAWVKQRKS
ncbi:MAG: type II toxin-antitoxin system HipA family toxin [Actinomycetota bacterium]